LCLQTNEIRLENFEKLETLKKAAAPKRTNTVIIPNEKKIDEITALRRMLAGTRPSFLSSTSPAPAI
jgi:hypothetical protein